NGFGGTCAKDARRRAAAMAVMTASAAALDAPARAVAGARAVTRARGMVVRPAPTPLPPLEDPDPERLAREAGLCERAHPVAVAADDDRARARQPHQCGRGQRG